MLAILWIAAVAAILGGLWVSYRHHADVNVIFRAGARHPLLGPVFPAFVVAMLTVFATAWSLRLDHAAAVVPGWWAEGQWLFAAGLATLLGCEALVGGYWLRYVRLCWIGTQRSDPPPASEGPLPPVLVLIPACDEPPEVLRRSLASTSRLDYPDARVILVENSRRAERRVEAIRLARELRVEVLRVPNRGTKAAALNDALDRLGDDAPLLCVIDADQAVGADLLTELVPRLLVDDALAFVQSAQGYANTSCSWVARAAAQQEMMLYDALMEARGALERAPCCGTNFVMRAVALRDVGGWDERALSEDQVTAFHMHWRGWRSRYHRALLAEGLGPADLGSYWRQQYRWAYGATTMALQVLGRALADPRTAWRRRGAVLDALWSSCSYVTTLALGVLATLPVALLAVLALTGASVGAPVDGAAPSAWALSVYPMYGLVMLFPYLHMRLRGYPLRNLLLVQGLLAVTLPLYLRAVLHGLRGGLFRFEPSRKGGRARWDRWWEAPQTWLFAALLVTGPGLLVQIGHVATPRMLGILLAWTLFYTVSIGHYFVFLGDGLRRAAPERESAGPIIN